MEYKNENNQQHIDFSNLNSNNDGPQPGPCPVDPQTGQPNCPPPTELVCIKTQKVYESCLANLENEEVADLTCIAVGEIQEVACKDPVLLDEPEFPFVCEKIPGTNRARVRFFYQYRFAYLDQEAWKQFESDPVFVEKVVIFSDRILDPRIFVQCEVFLQCTAVFITDPQIVTVCIGKGLVFKLFADVQLLIPAYGFCPEPDPCVQPPLAVCPPFALPWPPYPPQPDIVANPNIDLKKVCIAG